ncbi:uncharacterized protein METZ01_LOCUS500693, partial [marine metagenome]
ANSLRTPNPANTTAGPSVLLGSGIGSDPLLSGSADEFRISNVERGARWIRYSAENQKQGSTFLSTMVEYLMAPQMPSEMNASVAMGVPFSYAIPASPPATEYNATGMPTWATLNVATGEVAGTPDATGIFSVTVTATNAKGSTTTTLHLQSIATPTLASVTALEAKDLEGRAATILGDVNSTGGKAPIVTVFYGKTDAGPNYSGWEANASLGTLDQGPFEAKLSALDSGETYFF